MSGANSSSEDESSVVVVVKRSPSQEDVTRSPLHQPDLDQEPEIDLEQEMESQRSISAPDSPNSFMLLPLPLGQFYTISHYLSHKKYIDRVRKIFKII